MDCRCSHALPVMTGWGPPEQPWDPEEYAPVYVDLKSGRSWVAAGVGWLPVHVPLAWLQEELAEAVSDDDWITINRGGSPGDYDGQEDYFVSRVADLVNMVRRSLRLNDLSDVDAPRPGDNDALVFDGAKWVNGLIPYALDDLSDVSVSSAAIGQVLSRSGDTWVAAPVRRLLDELEDVDARTPKDRDILLYDAASMRWVPGRLTLKLNDLEDVEALPARGDYLTFDGTLWRATFGRQAVPAVCGDCFDAASAVPVGYWFDRGNMQLLRVGLDGSTDPDNTPDVVVCVDSGRVFARSDATTWIEIDLVTPAGHNVVVSTVEAADLAAAQAAGLQPGQLWLKNDGENRELRFYADEGCDIASGLKPKLIITSNTCRMYTGANDSTGAFSIAPVGPYASQVCVDPCDGSPWTERVSLQEALCMIVGGAIPTITACNTEPEANTAIPNDMPLDQALCALDQALQQVQSQLSSLSISVGPCNEGPLTGVLTAAQAVCQLSTIIGGAPTSLPIAATDVTVQPCSSGVVNAAMNAQQAICALSAAVAQPIQGTMTASQVSMASCPGGLLGSYSNLQDAICALSSGVAGFASYALIRKINLGIYNSSATNIALPASLPTTWTVYPIGGIQSGINEYPGGSVPPVFATGITADGVEYLQLPAGTYVIAANVTLNVHNTATPADQGYLFGMWDVTALGDPVAMDSPLLSRSWQPLGEAQPAWSKVMDIQFSGIITLSADTQVCFNVFASPNVEVDNDIGRRLNIFVLNLAKRVA